METIKIRLTVIVAVIAVFNLIPFSLQAQNNTNSAPMKSYFYLQPNVGLSQYFGDLNEKDYWCQTPQFGAGIVLGYQLNPVFSIRSQFMKTILHSEKTDVDRLLISDLWDGALHVTVNINEIFADYNDKRLLNFYLYSGAAISSFKSYLETIDPHLPYEQHDERQYTFALPIGAGASIRVSNAVSINLEYADRTVFNPTILDFTDGGNSNNDHYSYTSAGVQIKIGVKDTDEDGVRDKDDICPETPGKISLSGCPDKDNDNIADKDDACPDLAGISEFKGCPDTDGDNIPDTEDACPDAAGKKELNGCPDKDNDGIADRDDQCPDAAGKIEMAGCPDRDGDAIADIHDLCPDVKGLAQFSGCPDTDGDSIPDNKDTCPEVAGVPANNGCPEVVQESVVELLLQKTVFFGSDKSTVLNKSVNDMDEIAAYLIANPDVNISVAGFADNRESEEYNLRLSEKRSEAVINYLKKKGVDTSKIEKLYFGKDNPVADNSTAAGRALNRRVEIKITK
jgi:outer membrane protein OmpA-like peptidoglycan-associated protein